MVKGSMEHQYWNMTASKYDDATSFIVGLLTQQELKNWLKRQIDCTYNVLELGCGTGVFSNVIAGKAQKLIATDLSDKMLNSARVRLQTFDNVIVQKEDSYHVKFPGGMFDAVFLGNLLHIVAKPTMVLDEVYRVLRKNGKVISIDATWYGLSLWSKIGMALRYLKAFGIPPKTNKNMKPEEIAGIVKNAGFEIVELVLIGQETKAICLNGYRKEEI